ncbi:CRISPR-associated protein, Csh2 family [Hydrogenobacter thermophilus TK-6]|uniref:CRISPR-associated protein n=1 Tax=Hydrogenobacter thermophilus (strain DSM 6534 / IAM 12695 / TK-6) TaxID=608538 RepID=D3DIQ1_HYDTT|nr:type I-B CRISPR-associated protein Cas7/Csh2 [Hydrogenobacter thermophilus]ADO45629.1 CRISPR-associated protein, Csh2 family [Hydrogenobacter thermophilus TK-6]BAI69703.1 CRISPR-associated protein [Hydrogenobacter thermophilus TK-6]
MKSRREFLFIYDVSWANPNGDTMDENKPRIDEETGINYVTDVRLKRTVRDQLAEMGHEVFIKEERTDDGNLKTKESIFAKYGNDYNQVLEKCIDIRLFGGTFAIKNQQRCFTGPVQFKFGKSLHRVKMEFVKGTTVMPSAEQKAQGTMTEMYVVPYSLIVFYGIANENAAKETKLKDEDIDIMLKALWVGHKSSTDVISRSKFGHEPRLLIEIIYKEGTLTHMGELDKLVRINTDKRDEEIRDIEEVEIDLSRLKEKVQKYKDKIEKVNYIINDRIRIEPSLKEVFSGIAIEEFKWAKEV